MGWGVIRSCWKCRKVHTNTFWANFFLRYVEFLSKFYWIDLLVGSTRGCTARRGTLHAGDIKTLDGGGGGNQNRNSSRETGMFHDFFHVLFQNNTILDFTGELFGSTHQISHSLRQLMAFLQITEGNETLRFENRVPLSKCWLFDDSLR